MLIFDRFCLGIQARKTLEKSAYLMELCAMDIVTLARLGMSEDGKDQAANRALELSKLAEKIREIEGGL